MGVDDPANHIQLSGVEAVATSQLDRFEPELARAVLSLDVHVRRLIAVKAGEEDPVRPRNALDSWHSDVLAPLRAHPPNRTWQTPPAPLKRQYAERCVKWRRACAAADFNAELGRSVKLLFNHEIRA